MATSTSVQRIGVGIDTARYGHRVCFMRDDLQPAAPALSVPESLAGYRQLEQRLRSLRDKFPAASFHVRLDAAGQYAANLEGFLRSLDLQLPISVGEPKRNKDYHHAHSPKRQTDDTESWAMARYAVVEQPKPTLGVPPEHAVLRRACSRLQAQTKQTTRLVNQLHETLAAAFPEFAPLVRDLTKQWVLRLLQLYPTAQRLAAAHLETLRKIPHLKEEMAAQIHAAARDSVGRLRGELAEELVRRLVRELQASLDAEDGWKKLMTQAFDALPAGKHQQIETIIGIGKVTAAAIVATAIDIQRFATYGHLVGFYGVFPQECSSGVDQFGRPNPPGKKDMCAKGNDLVRALLWNCARSAARHNPAIRSLFLRLTQRAKDPVREDVAYGYCMTKLLRIVFAIWTTGKPFDPQHYAWEPAEPSLDDASVEPKSVEPQPQQVPSASLATPPATPTRPTSSDQDLPGAKEAAGRKEHCSAEKAVTAALPTVIAAAACDQPASSELRGPTTDHRDTASRPPVTAAADRPGRFVDFAVVRRQVTFEQILRHLGLFHGLRRDRKPGQYRGACPLHRAPSGSKHRSFSVNLDQQVFQCFHPPCKQSGDVLAFWAAYHSLSLHDAALHLVDTFGLDPGTPPGRSVPPRASRS